MNFSLCGFFIFLLLFFCSCKKEIAPAYNSGCLSPYLSPSFPADDPNFECCNCGFDVQEIYSSAIPYDYYYPFFNPDNRNQIVYYRGDNTQSIFKGYEIWFLDFCTQKRQLLAKDALYGIELGANDWVFYTAINQNIYKIKSNGDSLTQVTFTHGGYNRDPKLSPSGTQLLYQTEVNGITNLLIRDFNTGEFDTIKTASAAGSWCWIDANRIFYAVWRNTAVVALCVFDIKTRQETEIQELSVGASIALLIANAQYLKKDNSIIWCAYKTVGKTNINTGEHKILLNAFENEVFLG
ncbi:MAG: hypothetical protein Q8K92_13280, partial [Leadbetterella sp.]|nr:hypothetical protein [Leadbetterella sp.]